jgi:hypothetical protein
MANGLIQPLGGYSGLDRICSITIVAPSDHQIEISCSSVSFDINLGVTLHDHNSFLRCALLTINSID